MIEFEHRLPAFRIDGKPNGQYNNPEMILPGVLTTTDYNLGEFLHTAHNVVQDERRLVFIDGRVLTCCHNWIRDHVHMSKAFRHYEFDLKTFLQYIIDKQTDEGFFYELIKQLDDKHWQYVNDDCFEIFAEDNVALVRLELEADVEYLVVEGCLQYYRATGDAEWIKSVLPKLEKSIEYCLTSPKRFDKKLGLVIRPYTIDTWDFVNDPATVTDRRIHDDEVMCAMHGDNSGVYAAMNTLARFNEMFGNDAKAADWRKRAEVLKGNMFKHLWNGKFFVHQLPVNGPPIDDKENIRLSLSNGYDINRGVTDPEQSRAVIKEYMDRRNVTDAFAEWFSIDPPYPSFIQYKEGEYVNGAICPFTAGEIALAAFNNGYEEYGWDIISRMVAITQRDKRINFLYNRRDDGAQNETGPSGWGAAALINAVDEGLAGVVDKTCLYQEIDFSPRFTVTHYKELRYITGYECSRVFIDVRYIVKDRGMRYDVYSDAQKINAHILLPKGKTCKKLYVNGKEVKFKTVQVASSVYVDFVHVGGKMSAEIIF